MVSFVTSSEKLIHTVNQQRHLVYKIISFLVSYTIAGWDFKAIAPI